MKSIGIALMLVVFPTVTPAQVAICDGNGEGLCPATQYFQANGHSATDEAGGEGGGGGEGGEGIGHCDTIGECRSDTLPPAPPALTCTPLNSWHECEVWPQGPGFSYIWSAVSPAMLASEVFGSRPSGSPAAVSTPYQAFSCKHTEANGQINVTVISPSGTRSQGRFSLNCVVDLPLPTDPVVAH
jgi:hypothetical protein